MIRLTMHVQTRMQQRKIALAWIEAILAAPDWVADDKDPTLTQSFKAITECDGRVLKVVHRRLEADLLVVTAYFDRGARP